MLPNHVARTEYSRTFNYLKVIVTAKSIPNICRLRNDMNIFREQFFICVGLKKIVIYKAQIIKSDNAFSLLVGAVKTGIKSKMTALE